jgi:hypothetical protein
MRHTADEPDGILQHHHLAILARLDDDRGSCRRAPQRLSDRRRRVDDDARRLGNRRRDVDRRDRRRWRIRAHEHQYQQNGDEHDVREPHSPPASPSRRVHRTEASRDLRRRRFLDDRRPESLAFDVDDGDVILAAGGVGRIDQRRHDVVRTSRRPRHDLVDGRRIDEVRQAIAAEQQRRIRLEGHLVDIDEIRIRRIVPIRADVAVDLVAARVLHRVELGQLARVLALADRRMIAGDFLDAAVMKFVEPGVADVADDRAPVGDHDRGQHAGHAAPLGSETRQAVNLVVRDRDRFAQAPRDRSGLALEARPQHADGGIGRLAAGRLTADAVDDHEEPAGHVDVVSIFVDLALQPRMGLARGLERPHRRRWPGGHGVSPRYAVHTYTPTSASRIAAKNGRAQSSAVIMYAIRLVLLRPISQHQSCSAQFAPNCRNTVSARPIVAGEGSAVSAPFSRFVPSTSS